ncbi:hypothetical protein ANCCAN_27889 [Ancylostoma caninum]|uniref:Uncharacterized protein n=1 Tax=Ancylostoma caninum TaxID=29170 RepID=A0A368F672_ANCCA|nr:hypothetical protein ANCCAN_27889 [Ancylostoma caninum]
MNRCFFNDLQLLKVLHQLLRKSQACLMMPPTIKHRYLASSRIF